MIRKTFYEKIKERTLQPYLLEKECYPFKLPKLKYETNSLEPFLNQKQFDNHVNVHHQAYVNNLNYLFEKYPDMQKFHIDQLLCCGRNIHNTLRNNLGGHKNHTLFWEILAPQNDNKPTGQLLDAINSKFGTFEELKKKFNQVATAHFGSGWTWLSLNNKNTIIMSTTLNQGSPLYQGIRPFFLIDTWEHAYITQYKGIREDYINKFWEFINWEKVSEFYKKALDYQLK